MAEFGITLKLIRLTRACLEGSRVRVRVDGDLSEVFHIISELKQGDAHSSILINIVLEKPVREARIEAQVFQTNYPKLILAYADDIDIIV